MVCKHLLGRHDAALAAADELSQRYRRVPDAFDFTMVTFARVIAMCPFDPDAAAALLYRHLEETRRPHHLGLERHFLVLLALVDLHLGDERAAADSLALCDGPFDVITPLVWEYRHRVEGWPTEEFDQRRLASVGDYVSDPEQFTVVSERIDALLARRADVEGAAEVRQG